MNTFSLRINFALQSKSSGNLAVSHFRKDGRGMTAMVNADAYPHRGMLQLEGLMPGRHYLLQGAARRFCRADAAGTTWIELALQRPSLLIVTPVI
jgi:hypothetical protein